MEAITHTDRFHSKSLSCDRYKMEKIAEFHMMISMPFHVKRVPEDYFLVIEIGFGIDSSDTIRWR